MKTKYTNKQLKEAIKYWQAKLMQLNESDGVFSLGQYVGGLADFFNKATDPAMKAIGKSLNTFVFSFGSFSAREAALALATAIDNAYANGNSSSNASSGVRSNGIQAQLKIFVEWLSESYRPDDYGRELLSLSKNLNECLEARYSNAKDFLQAVSKAVHETYDEQMFADFKKNSNVAYQNAQNAWLNWKKQKKED